MPDAQNENVDMLQHVEALIALTESRIRGDLQRLEERQSASETATTLAREMLAIRLDHSNNTLAHMEEQQKEAGVQLARLGDTFARATEVALSVGSLGSKIDSVDKALSGKIDGVSERVWKIAIATAAAGGTVGAAITKYLL